MVLQRKDTGRYDKKNHTESTRVSGAPHQRANWNYDGQKSEQEEGRRQHRMGVAVGTKERVQGAGPRRAQRPTPLRNVSSSSGATNAVLPGEHQGCLLKYGFLGLGIRPESVSLGMDQNLPNENLR